jgi:hypothetical protein
VDASLVTLSRVVRIVSVRSQCRKPCCACAMVSRSWRSTPLRGCHSADSSARSARNCARCQASSLTVSTAAAARGPVRSSSGAARLTSSQRAVARSGSVLATPCRSSQRTWSGGPFSALGDVFRGVGGAANRVLPRQGEVLLVDLDHVAERPDQFAGDHAGLARSSGCGCERVHFDTSRTTATSSRHSFHDEASSWRSRRRGVAGGPHRRQVGAADVTLPQPAALASEAIKGEVAVPVRAAAARLAAPHPPGADHARQRPG